MKPSQTGVDSVSRAGIVSVCVPVVRANPCIASVTERVGNKNSEHPVLRNLTRGLTWGRNSVAPALNSRSLKGALKFGGPIGVLKF